MEVTGEVELTSGVRVAGGVCREGVVGGVCVCVFNRIHVVWVKNCVYVVDGGGACGRQCLWCVSMVGGMGGRQCVLWVVWAAGGCVIVVRAVWVAEWVVRAVGRAECGGWHRAAPACPQFRFNPARPPAPAPPPR